jgi:hypothetical protein
MKSKVKKLVNKTAAIGKLIAIAEIEAVTALRRGNTILLDHLMHVVAQECIAPMTPKQGKGASIIVHHGFISTYEEIFDTLIEAGVMAENVKNGFGYRLLWDKLEKRKKDEGFCNKEQNES